MRPTSGFSSPSWSAEREGRPEGRPLEAELALGGPDAVRPRSLLALLDVEADGLATAQTVEVERRIDATLMEEILLTIVGGDEPESTVGNDLLDGALWHLPNSSSRTPYNASACSREKNTGRTRDRPKSGRTAVVYHGRSGGRNLHPRGADDGSHIAGGLWQLADLGRRLTDRRPDRITS